MLLWKSYYQSLVVAPEQHFPTVLCLLVQIRKQCASRYCVVFFSIIIKFVHKLGPSSNNLCTQNDHLFSNHWYHFSFLLY